MAFKDVLKKQRQSGKGLLSSLGSSASQTIREKMDYRNSLFKSGGMLNALFPNVKGFKAGENLKIPKQAKPETEKTIISMDNTEVVQELSRVASKLDIVGKNTMVLPIIMRDMNVMRQGILKLVKLAGGTQRDKADRFFQTSSERESIYESKLAKTKASTTPTNIKQVPEEKKKSLLDTIFDFMPGLFKLVLGGIAAGGIVSILGKDTIKDGLKTLFTGIVNLFVDGVKLSLEVISEMMNDPEVTKKFKELGDTLWNFAKDHPFLTLGAAVTMFGGTITSLLGVLALATTVGKGFLGKAFKLLSLMGLGAAAGAIIAENSTPGVATPGAEGQPGVSGTPGAEGQSGVPNAVNTGKSMTKLEGAAAGAEAVGGVIAGVSGVKKVAEISKATGTAILDARTQSVGQLAKAEATTTWGKFLKFVAKKSPALWGKIGVKLAQAGTLATIPVAGWIGALISLGFAAWTAWDLYQLWQEFNGSGQPEVEDNSPTPMENTVDAMGNVTGAPGSPPDVERGRPTMKNDPRRTDKAPKTPTSPTPSNGTTSNGTPSSYSEVVGKSESGGNYDTVFGQPGNAKINGKPVTQNTIGEVIEWQNKMRSSNKHAAGKYQFINVADAAKNAGLSTNALFDGINQEVMQNAFTQRNAQTLKQSGIEPTNQNLGLAHSVGATGASKLLQAQQSGQGNLIAADVLGLKGAARDTNPHLMKPVSQVIASNESKFNGISPSGVTQPPSTMVAQAPTAPARPATQIASASTSLADTVRKQMQTPVVINAPTTNNNNVRNGGNGGQRSTTAPSIIDSELMKLLVGRIAT